MRLLPGEKIIDHVFEGDTGAHDYREGCATKLEEFIAAYREEATIALTAHRERAKNRGETKPQKVEELPNDWRVVRYKKVVVPFKPGDVLTPAPSAFDVGYVVALLSKRMVEDGIETPIKVCDVGGGSGAEAADMMINNPEIWCLIIDKDKNARKTARLTMKLNGIPEERFEIRDGDFLKEVEGKFHFVVSNPPYDTEEIAQARLEQETIGPKLATYGGKDGLDAYRTIAEQAGNLLYKPGGSLVFRFPWHLAVDVGIIAKTALENTGHQVSVMTTPASFTRANPANHTVPWGFRFKVS